MNAAGGPCSCCPDRKRDEKTCFLQERAITLLRKLVEAAVPTAVEI